MVCIDFNYTIIGIGGIKINVPSTIWRNHSLIPELVGAQDIDGCIGASKRKLEGILSLGNQLISDLPAAYLETYEFLAIAKVSNNSLKIE